MIDRLITSLRNNNVDSNEYQQTYLAIFGQLNQLLDNKKLRSETYKAYGTDLSHLPDWFFTALGKVAFLVNRDVPLAARTDQWVARKLAAVRGEPAPTPPEPVREDLADVLREVINTATVDDDSLTTLLSRHTLNPKEVRRIQQQLANLFGDLSRVDIKKMKLVDRSKQIRRRWAYEAVKKKLEMLMVASG